LQFLVVSDDIQVGRWLQHRVATLREDCSPEAESYEALDRRLATTGTRGIDILFAVLPFDGDAAASLSCIDRLQNIPDIPPLVVIAEGGDELSAVQSMRRGAVDYLPRKLITAELLDASITHGLEKASQAAPSSVASASPPGAHGDTALPTILKLPRDLIPRYVLLDTLGESARATVYLANSAALNRHVALKVSRVVESGEALFSREYETVGGIRHPSVVDIYDYGMHDGREFIAMEYFPCGDLKARLQNPVSEHEAIDYLQRIAAALSVVHNEGILHRDLKPPNIMLREDGQIVLIDFGLAKSIENATRSTAAGVLRGSPYYMSPEQAQGHELDGRSDMYSLGIIFFEMLTGGKPYLGATAIEVLQQHVSAAVPELPAELQQHQPLLDGMMANARDDRFATMDDLLASLAQAAA
jgi:ActR/RegA family two-component response regulator/predicted Ser/Thr protein kinase